MALGCAAAVFAAARGLAYAQEGPPPPPPPPPSAPGDAAPSAAPGLGPVDKTLDDYAVIGEVNVFRPWDDTPEGATRPDPEPVDEPGPQDGAADDAEINEVENYAGYQLTGTVDFGEGMRAVINKAGTLEWAFYGEGDEVADGIRVDSIEEGKAVVLDHGPQRIRLALKKQGPQSRKVSAPAGRPDRKAPPERGR